MHLQISYNKFYITHHHCIRVMIYKPHNRCSVKVTGFPVPKRAKFGKNSNCPPMCQTTQVSSMTISSSTQSPVTQLDHQIRCCYSWVTNAIITGLHSPTIIFINITWYIHVLADLETIDTSLFPSTYNLHDVIIFYDQWEKENSTWDKWHRIVRHH